MMLRLMDHHLHHRPLYTRRGRNDLPPTHSSGLRSGRLAISRSIARLPDALPTVATGRELSRSAALTFAGGCFRLCDQPLGFCEQRFWQTGFWQENITPHRESASLVRFQGADGQHDDRLGFGVLVLSDSANEFNPVE
jgi:hypothetical protein